MAAAATFAIALFLGPLGARAQQPPDAPTEAAAPTTAPIEEAPGAPLDGGLSPEELQALVAPIALYPDLVLVLALQASLAPLDIVQAERFLARYAEDPSLVPDPDWDESVIGLLNYPSVVQTMSEDLEWTDTLGTAVITQLEGVQDAIQEIRAFMRAIGALESNDKLTVIAEGDIIRIEPTDEDAVFVPVYDPEALLAALYSTDVAPPPAEPLAEPEGEAIGTGTGEAATESVEVEAAAPVDEAAPVSEVAPAAPVSGVAPAAAAAYYPAVAPPPVTYSDPAPSWLGTAATFAGGAIVGGLVGWAIADDDDDDDDDDGGYWGRGDVSIEDSTIVVNRGGVERDDLQRQVQRERLEREAREKAQRDEARETIQTERLKQDARERAQREEAKRQLEQRYPEKQARAGAARGGGTTGQVSGLAASGSKQTPAVSRDSAGGKQLAARVDEAKVKADPSRREAAQARPAESKAVRPGDRKQPQAASAFGGTKSASEAKRESNRGLTSRSRATTEVKPNRSRDGGGAFAQRGGGERAQASRTDRGRQSRRGGR